MFQKAADMQTVLLLSHRRIVNYLKYLEYREGFNTVLKSL